MYYKVGKVELNVGQILQSGTDIKKWGNYYNEGQYNLLGDWNLSLRIPEEFDFSYNYMEDEITLLHRRFCVTCKPEKVSLTGAACTGNWFY